MVVGGKCAVYRCVNLSLTRERRKTFVPKVETCRDFPNRWAFGIIEVVPKVFLKDSFALKNCNRNDVNLSKFWKQILRALHGLSFWYQQLWNFFNDRIEFLMCKETFQNLLRLPQCSLHLMQQSTSLSTFDKSPFLKGLLTKRDRCLQEMSKVQKKLSLLYCYGKSTWLDNHGTVTFDTVPLWIP